MEVEIIVKDTENTKTIVVVAAGEQFARFPIDVLDNESTAAKIFVGALNAAFVAKKGESP